MATEPELVLHGQDVPCKVFLGNQPFGQSDTLNSIKITEDAVIHKDEYLGRDRSRFDKQISGYDCAIASDLTNTTLLAAILLQDAKREANQSIPELAIEVQLRQRNGLIKSLLLTKGVAKWDMSVGGRAEAAKFGLDMKFEKLLGVAL